MATELEGLFWPQLFAGCEHSAADRYASVEPGVGHALSRHWCGHGYAAEAVNLVRRLGVRIATNPDTTIDWPGVVGVAENYVL